MSSPTIEQRPDAPLLSVTGVRKAYGATQALDGVSVEARRGSIHALLGGNGSGKSTLIKILAGVVPADAGSLRLAGVDRDLTSHSPAGARAMNLHFVHQENSTFPDLSVAENLSIGRGFEVGALGRVRWGAVRRRAVDVLERFEIDVSPDAQLGRLSNATQMMVSIARALQDTNEADDDAILVLDEPTASLPTHEVDVLLTALRKYAGQGHTILYVTHRLQEILSYADEGTVLRDGKLAGTFDPTRVGHDDLVTMIMGQPIAPTVARADRGGRVEAQRSPVVLRAGGLGPDDTSLELRAGEVVGLAGILGSGRTRLLRQLFGIVPFSGTTLEIDGKSGPLRSPRHAMRRGVAYVPENRHDEAAFSDLSISRNLSVVVLPSHSRYWYVNRRSERAAARSLIAELGVKAASDRSPLSSLSGGNQQKVIMARWLQRKPRILLLDEPSQGVDVGARAEIHALIRKATREGAAVLLVSSDFDELAAACDRVLVVSDGRIVAEVEEHPAQEATLNKLVYSVEKP